MSPPEKPMCIFHGAKALEDMHSPCDSYLGRNRILPCKGRYQNHLRLRDHAQKFVLRTSGNKVYMNLSLTMFLSLCLRLIKTKYWNQNKNQFMITYGRCAPLFSKFTTLVEWKCFFLPRIYHNVRMFLWERSFVKL